MGYKKILNKPKPSKVISSFQEHNNFQLYNPLAIKLCYNFLSFVFLEWLKTGGRETVSPQINLNSEPHHKEDTKRTKRGIINPNGYVESGWRNRPIPRDNIGIEQRRPILIQPNNIPRRISGPKVQCTFQPCLNLRNNGKYINFKLL